jgi:hypothetical protein
MPNISMILQFPSMLSDCLILAECGVFWTSRVVENGLNLVRECNVKKLGWHRVGDWVVYSCLPCLVCSACAHFHLVNDRECAGSVPPVVRMTGSSQRPTPIAKGTATSWLYGMRSP